MGSNPGISSEFNPGTDHPDFRHLFLESDHILSLIAKITQLFSKSTTGSNVLKKWRYFMPNFGKIYFDENFAEFRNKFVGIELQDPKLDRGRVLLLYLYMILFHIPRPGPKACVEFPCETRLKANLGLALQFSP